MIFSSFFWTRICLLNFSLLFLLIGSPVHRNDQYKYLIFTLHMLLLFCYYRNDYDVHSIVMHSNRQNPISPTAIYTEPIVCVHLFHFFYVCLISFVTGIHLLHKFPFFRIAILFAVVLAQVCLLPSILGSFDPWHRHRHKHTKRKTWRRKGTDHANRHNFQGANYSIVWSLEFEHSMAFEFVSLKLKENA